MFNLRVTMVNATIVKFTKQERARARERESARVWKRVKRREKERQ